MGRARKRFGQHFLEPAWVTKLVGAIDPAPADRFLEIGPGRGAITAPLSARAGAIVAVEVDRDLVAALSARGMENVRVVSADVLDVDLVALARELAAPSPDGGPASSVRVVGNLPYNISSPILFRLLEASVSGLFKDATLMLQAEVADRLTAKAGTGDYGVLTLSAMIRADVRQLLALPPGAFRPAPKVRSAVVRLDFRPPPPEVREPERVVTIVRSVFTRRRKTMSNALAPLAGSTGIAQALLASAGIDPQRRPETLSLADYARLADLLPTGPLPPGP